MDLALTSKVRYPITVGSVDIETFALDNNAVVIEVAVARLTLSPNRDYVYPQHLNLGVTDLPLVQTQPEKFVFSFDVLDQIARGRVFNSDTYLFHTRQAAGRKGVNDMVVEGLYHSPQAMRLQLEEIQKRLEPCDEVWINGLSFDPPILGSLAASYEYVSGIPMNRLWQHSKERDLRTIRKLIALESSDSADAKHRALDDTLWNLSVVCQLHQKLAASLPALISEGNPTSTKEQ